MSERVPPKGRRSSKPTVASGSRPATTGAAAARQQSRRGTAETAVGRVRPADAAPRPVGPRRERYLVALLAPAADGATPAAPMGSAPLGSWRDPDPAGAGRGGAENLLAYLRTDPSCVVHRVILPPSGAGPDQSRGPSLAAFPPVAIVDMDADRAAMFALSGAMLHVEPDLPLHYGAVAATAGLTFADPGVMPPGDELAVLISVVGSDHKALDGAEVYLMSGAFPVRGTTGADGTVMLNLPASPLRGIYVRPRCDYWAVWLGRPELAFDAPNLVTCPAFAETFPGFPERQLDSWAPHALRFDAVPPTFRGHGVRIAVIDSGAAAEHPDLAGRIAGGRDITVDASDGAEQPPAADEPGWRIDTVGHGSHCTGIIGGSDNGHGVIGVAPEAEIHVCKIFPDGRFSDLLDALDYCITHQIDVVNLSLGSPQPSGLLARKIEQARQAGVACVVAAGSSGGPVAFPASLPSVLAVAAIGKIGEYPPESYHATQVHGVPTPEGYFSAAFTCFGPEIDVCAPGVGIVSSVPPTNYAAWDGTSFAAPYVTGLAALLLAHHPEFRDRRHARDAARVGRLFEIIKHSCRPLHLGDPGRSGAGLPDAVAAFGLAPQVPAIAPAGTASTTGSGAVLSPLSSDPLGPLRAALSAAGLLPFPC